MPIKYWEFEDAPLKEKLKSVNIKDVSKIFFDNETEAYRFSVLMLEVKKKGALRLKEVPEAIPIATAKRYLDFAVQIGMLKHEANAYSMTDRYSKPLKNIATYIKAWMDSSDPEDLALQFVNAKTDKQIKRGGKSSVSPASPAQPSENPDQQN